MARSWSDIKLSRMAREVHPLSAAGGITMRAAAANSEALAAAGKASPVSLSVGDPALDGNLPPPAAFSEAVVAAHAGATNNGYAPSTGLPAAREAVAAYWTKWFAPSLSPVLSGADVLLTTGCSDALAITVASLANPGDVVLLPSPYFAQYAFTVRFYGAVPQFYPCLPHKGYEVDLAALRAMLTADAQLPQPRIKCLVLNNPSNPCGSNWSRAHVTDILAVMADFPRVPVVADEIYAGITYAIEDYPAGGAAPPTAAPAPSVEAEAAGPVDSSGFTSVADVAAPGVARLVLAGASKRFNMPGMRLGWILRVDPSGALAEVFAAMARMTARYVLPMTSVQAAFAQSALTVGAAYFQRQRDVLGYSAAAVTRAIRERVPQLEVLAPPAGGMFMVAQLKEGALEESVGGSGADFAAALAREENVHVFPGEPFLIDRAVRITLSRPPEVTMAALQRIEEFCARHQKK